MMIPTIRCCGANCHCFLRCFWNTRMSLKSLSCFFCIHRNCCSWCFRSAAPCLKQSFCIEACRMTGFPAALLHCGCRLMPEHRSLFLGQASCICCQGQMITECCSRVLQVLCHCLYMKGHCPSCRNIHPFPASLQGGDPDDVPDGI